MYFHFKDLYILINTSCILYFSVFIFYRFKLLQGINFYFSYEIFVRDLTFYKMTGSKYNLSFIFRSFENHADEIILKIYTHNFTQFRLIFST